MAFVLNSHITIGSVSFKGVNECRIKRGIHSYVDTATLKVPTSARLKQADATTVSVQSAQQFKRGDKVEIKLGYNGSLKSEFVGFVSRLNFTTPFEIECEGYSYLLRQKNINTTFSKGTPIKKVCEYITQGTDITLSAAIPNIQLGSALRVVNDTAAKVLDYLKSNFKFTIYFNGPQLYVGLEETEPKASVKYKLGWNTINDGGLKYHVAEESRVKVVMKTAKSEGGKDVYTVGDPDGAVHEFIMRNVAAGNAKQIAEDHLKKLKFTGYEGRVTTFLVPYSEHGYSAIVEDPKYPERNGTYFVPSIEVVYGMTGARRIVELSNKLSN